MKKIRTVPERSSQGNVMERLFRRRHPVRAGTRALAACVMAMMCILGKGALPASAEELPEELRRYGAEEIAISGTDDDSITQEAENGGVHVRKTLRNNKDGTLQIELESWVSGTSASRIVPVDVVLVLDTSSSMGFSMTDQTTRMEALKAAASRMVDSLEQQNEGLEEALQSRIAIVNYCDANLSGIRMNLTRADTGGAAAARETIQSLTYAGRTRIDEGMRYAQQIMNEQADAERSRVVILYTDGTPNHESQTGFVMEKANQCIETARSLKEAGVRIFSITVEPRASAVPGEALPSYTKGNEDFYIAPFYDPTLSYYNTSDENGLALINRFMYLMSSDNPHAQDMDTPNALDFTDPGSTRGEDRETYYYTAAASSALSDVLHAIAEDVSHADAGLTALAEARDEILAPFCLEEERDITVSVSDYLGNGGWGPPRDITGEVEVKASGGKVVVGGYDYAAAFVSEQPHLSESADGSYRGSKLIISFTIRPQATFGGNQLPTNSAASGIYSGSGASEAAVCYPVPAADIKPRCAAAVQDLHVYVPDTVFPGELLRQQAARTADGSRNAQVDLSYEMRDAAGNLVGERYIPAGRSADTCNWTWYTEEISACGTYRLRCTATPVREGHFTACSSEESAAVHVFHPELQVCDATCWYGEPATVEPGDATDASALGEHLTRLVWKCSDETTSQTGEEPLLGYRIAIPRGVREEEGVLLIDQLEDVPVIVGVYRQEDGALGADITEQSVFSHSCSRENCGYDAAEDGKKGIRFLLHVKERPMQEKVVLPDTGAGGAAPYAWAAGGFAVLLAGWKCRRKLCGG